MTDKDVMLPYIQPRDPYRGPRLHYHLEGFSDWEIGQAVMLDNPCPILPAGLELVSADPITLSCVARNAFQLLGEPRFLHNPYQLGTLLRMAHVADFQHRDKYRRTGDMEVEHMLAVYGAAVSLGFTDYALLAACLGHDELEDSPLTLGILLFFFGREIAFLIDGVTSEPRLGRLASYNKLVYYASRDPRVYLIKLLDNGCNLKTVIGREGVEMDRNWQISWLQKLLGPNRDALLRCRQEVRRSHPSLFRLTEPIFEMNMAEGQRILDHLTLTQPKLAFA